MTAYIQDRKTKEAFTVKNVTSITVHVDYTAIHCIDEDGKRDFYCPRHDESAVTITP